MTFSIFDQFELTKIVSIHPFGNFDISITNSTIFMGIAFLIFYLLNRVNIYEGKLIPERWQSVLELCYEFIHTMVKDTIGKEGAAYFPLIFTLFVFIGLLNLVGLIPYTFTPTAHIAVTFGLSLTIFLAVTLIGLVRHKADFFSMFLPAGSPIALAPFLIIIEFISHGIKAISLGVRLAANITSGHLLFTIIAGFTWKLLIAGSYFSLISIFPFLIILFITGLEIAVALIQVYVFCILTSIYINDSIHLH